jgi:hypothetical protein
MSQFLFMDLFFIAPKHFEDTDFLF